MKITLVLRAKTDRGWRFFPVLRNGPFDYTPRVDDGGVVKEYPGALFYLRMWRDSRIVYEPLGTRDMREARLTLERREREAKAAPVETNPRNHIKSAVSAYITNLEEHTPPRMEAAAHARVTLGEFSEYCKGVGLVKSITREHVQAWFVGMTEKGLSGRTQFNRFVRLKAWLRWCRVSLDFLPDAPRYEKKEPTIYSASQVDAILKAPDARMRIVILLGLKCGLRMGEIAHAAWSDLSEDYLTLKVTSKPAFNWSIKDGEQRTVPLTADLREELKAWREEKRKGRVLIVGTRSDKPDRHLLRSLKRFSRSAGLACGECDGCRSKARECRTFNLHKLRRSYGTSLLRAGVDLASVQGLLGHADITSTRRYLRGKVASEVAAKIETVRWGG